PPAPSVRAPSVPEHAIVRATALRRSRTTTTPPPPASPSTSTSEPPSAAGKPIDLFAAGVLAEAAGTRSSPPSDRETIAGRVHETLGDAAARERAQSGNVAPHWRDIERKLVQEFHPPIGVVKQENVVKALAHQILRAWLDGPPQTATTGPVAPVAIDPSVETLPGTPPGLNLKSLPEAQALAVQARWGEPAMWLRVEVEVTIDDDGNVTGARVTRPSGRRMFDRTALAAVEDAIRRGGAPDEHRTVVTRWLVEAAVAVSPPTSVGFRFDETGHLNPGAKGLRKYLAPTYPMQQSVISHVSLVAIE
ncbi:MAG TPA: energy transducer TonB, partial [Polyangia bacterium]